MRPSDVGRVRALGWIVAVVPVLLSLAGGTSAQAPGAVRETLREELGALLEEGGAPGLSLGVVLPDGTVFGVTAGWADTLRREPMSVESRTLLGSVGKTYFGAAALQLVGEGLLDLDAPMARYFDDAPWLDRLAGAREATLRHLMGHTSGIVRYEFTPEFVASLTADPLRSYSPEDRLAFLFDREAPFAPGEGWEYSDTNYILVAMLIEAVTGNTAYGEIRRRFLDPLDLAETAPSDRPDVPGIVQGYAGPRNPFGGFDEMVAGGALRLNPQFEWGGGGFAASARDLARWTHHVQTGRAFDPSLLDDFRSGHAAPLGPGGEYGLGVIMLRLPSGRAWGHSGFMPGYLTEAYHFPEQGFTLALLVNTSDQSALRMRPLLMVDRLAAALAEELAPGWARQTKPARKP